MPALLITIDGEETDVRALSAVELNAIALGLGALRRQMQTDGVRLPADVKALQERFAARSGHTRTTVDVAPVVADPAEQSLLLTYDDVAALLRVSERTVRRLVGNGQLLAVRVAGATRIRRSDLEEFVRDAT